jgi:uncharacterized protein (DUF2236 family)
VVVPSLVAMVLDPLISVRTTLGSLLRRAISGDEEVDRSALAHGDDPGLFGPGSPVWRVHGDLSMLIGGLRALLLQTLHPLAMAGVAEHSDYRHDPWGRLHRTGRFIGMTTFGTTAAAEEAIAVVRRVHERVRGVAPDGRPYSAEDPRLMLWVHLTEVDSFLRAYQRYGAGRLTDDEADEYVAQMAEVARRLGAADPPTDRAGLAACLESFRSELRVGNQARDAVRFLLVPPVPLLSRGAYGVIAAAAIGLLPGWVRRELWLPVPPLVDPLVIRPAALTLTRTMGWALATQDRRSELADQRRAS